MKSPLPNIFSSTAFKKHVPVFMDQNEVKVKQSELFFFLPATLDRKEDILQWKDNVHLHPINLTFDDLKAERSVTTFDPSLLENNHARESLKPGLYKVMKRIADLSNQNLVRNSGAFISNGGKADSVREFVWVDDSFKKGASKFQLNRDLNTGLIRCQLSTKGFFFNFILDMGNVLCLAIEVMPQKFLNYLPVTVICNLLFVSTYTRQFILKTFKKI